MNKLMNPKYPEGRNLFVGKNILLTASAGAGIGFSTAKRFLEEGANVFISDVHQGRLDQAIENLKSLKLGEVDGCLCNVTSDEEIDEMFSQALARYGQLDGVINNAGLGGESSLETMSNDAWNLVMDVTLNGAMKIMRAAIPILKETQGNCKQCICARLESASRSISLCSCKGWSYGFDKMCCIGDCR